MRKIYTKQTLTVEEIGHIIGQIKIPQNHPQIPLLSQNSIISKEQQYMDIYSLHTLRKKMQFLFETFGFSAWIFDTFLLYSS